MKVGAAVTALIGAVILGVVLLIGVMAGWTKPAAGEIGVIRNGGVLDDRNIRGVVENGSGNTWKGLWSTTHYYPVADQQRFFRMATCHGDDGETPCSGADALAVTVPTADGVEVTIEGTFYLNTRFDNSREGQETLKAFDTQFATRTFEGDHPYEGTEGWKKFLAANVEPIVVNNLRETISTVSCADLVSSCALVQNQGQQSVEDVQRRARGEENQTNIARIQGQVEDGLDDDLIATLGGQQRRAYFGNIQFNLARVLLPGSVQDAINDAQSSFAAVSRSQAKVQSARLDAEANALRQAGYRRCPTCARIDAIRALPSGLTALGGDFAIAVR